ncbi:hypothetical protein E6C60_4055 [Paenibacillus algicola]|uniref:Uncharacterized protein n=1 Tax=Paenibacillus algicola TaxID=2565926 RepID=A0A4P8XS06_9BACL|nr:hypothetical protein E6C60_4055 [Paenibacillus algicola]
MFVYLFVRITIKVIVMNLSRFVNKKASQDQYPKINVGQLIVR